MGDLQDPVEIEMPAEMLGETIEHGIDLSLIGKPARPPVPNRGEERADSSWAKMPWR
jgi:hypothetical protein